MDKAKHASVEKEKKNCEKNNAKIWGGKKQKKWKICNILYWCQYKRNLNNAGYIYVVGQFVL